MPEDFTSEQIQFLSKYLKPIEAKIKKKKIFRSSKKREANNAEVQQAIETLKSDYADWIKIKEDMADRLAKFELKYDLSKLPAQKTALADLQRRHDAVIRDVRSAPKDAPIFKDGEWELKLLRTELRQLDRAAQAATDALAPPPVTILFETSISEIDKMAAFGDHPTLSAKIVATALDDQTAEAARQAAVRDHAALCTAAKTEVGRLRDALLAGGDQADLEKQARMAVFDLRAARQVSLTALSAAVASGANAKLLEMSQGGDVVATREVARKDRLAADAGRLATALTKIDEKITGLQEDLDAAEGFQERRALLAEISAERDRKAELDTRAKQMVAYEAGAAHRLELITDAEDKREASEAAIAGIDPDGPDLDAQLAAWATGREGAIAPLETDNQENWKLLIAANIVSLKALVKTSSEKIVVDKKLYPDEADLTEISAAQYDTLLTMLTLAEDLCGKDKHAEARALNGDAMDLFGEFKQSRTFVLPDLPDEALDTGKRVASALKAVAVSIDRLWGLGGEDGPLRTRHKTLSDQADAAGRETPPDYRAVLAGIDALERDVGLALREAAQPKPADIAAKKAAGETSSKINESLLSMYRTEPVTEGEVGGIHPNDLLVVTASDGSKEYHRIRLRDEETVQRREDKKIPREAIDALRQQTQMLELLAQSEGAGCAEAVEEAARKAEEMRAAITGGAADYKRVTDALKAFDKAMGDKKLKEWRMNGIQDLTARKDKFESSYAASMLPADAASEAESLRDEAKAKVTATAAVKTKYERVKGVLDGIENKLSAKPKGSDATLGKVLADLIKKGPAAVSTGPLSVQEMAEVQRLQRHIEASIEEIKHLGQHGTGMQGELRKQLTSIRKTLDTKSEQGVNSAEQSAATLNRSVDTKLAEVSINPSTDALDYLRQIHALTNSVAKASREKVDAQEKAAELKESAKAAVAAAKTALDGATNLSSKVEYTAIYDSLKSQYESANKAWNKGKGDAEAAISGFEPVISNATELESDLKSLTKVKISSKSVDITGFQTALQNNIGKVASSAEAAATLIKTQADQSEEQTANTDLQTAITKVQATLRLVGTLSGVPTFPTTLQAEVDAAVAETDATKKKADLAKIREKTLTEIRRIRGRLRDDPALAAYRDNPFDHGASWPQFEAAILSCETEVIKSLNPGR
jgi:hypothetical protein